MITEVQERILLLGWDRILGTSVRIIILIPPEIAELGSTEGWDGCQMVEDIR